MNDATRGIGITIIVLGVPFGLALAGGCQPRHRPPQGATTASTTATVATVTPTNTQPTATTTATQTNTAPTSWQIPGLVIPGLPTSPRQAMIGKWNVAAIDGKPISTAPGMATDPMDPASYAAGSGVIFTADHVTIHRAGVNLMDKPYKVVGEQPPVRVTIDAGYGPSNVDFAIDGSCVWSLPSTPPHALSLTRAN